MSSPRVLIVAPAPARPRRGNRVTALRWALHLRALGCAARVREADDEGPFELAVLLHAEKSAALHGRLCLRAPAAPVVIALTGTDVYGEGRPTPAALASIAHADALVALEEGVLERLPEDQRGRVRVIPQSAPPRCPGQRPDPEHFDVLLAAHLRAVKDPLLAARAAARLPAGSRLRVTHLGEALEPGLEAEARALEGPRYRWLGAVPRREALGHLARSRLALVTSRSESGPSALCEALAAGVPVLATRIPGLVSLLGPDHPGLFESGNAEALADLLGRAEGDPAFLDALERAGARAAPRVDPAAERAAWAALLADLAHRSAFLRER